MKRISILLLFSLFSLLSFAAADITIGGVVFKDSNRNNKYEVSSKEHLIALSLEPSKLENRKFEQTADIVFNPDPALEDWDNDGNPDGQGTKGFNPIRLPVYNNQQTLLLEYSGNNKKIVNLYINRPNENYIGLFAKLYSFIEGANSSIPTNLNAMYDIQLINCSITGNNYVGGIAGDVMRMSVRSCTVSGFVNGGFNIGGIAGACTNSYFMYNSCMGIVQGNTFVGGIVGKIIVKYRSKFQESNIKAAVVGHDYVGSLTGLYQGLNLDNCLVSGYTGSQVDNVGKLFMGDFSSTIFLTPKNIAYDTQTTNIKLEHFKAFPFQTKDFVSDNLNLIYRTSELSSWVSPWVYPWIKSSKGRPFLYTQDISVDNSVVDKNRNIKGNININNASTTLSECGAMYKATHPDSTWHYIQFSISEKINDFIPQLKSGNTYYICAYAKDQNDVRYLGDMVKWQEKKVILHKNTNEDEELEVMIPLHSFWKPDFSAFHNLGKNISEWNTEQYGINGTSYYKNDSIYVGNEEIHLFARWQLNEHKIAYDNNSGIGVMPQQTYNYNAYASLLTNTFSKQGYRLTGWNTRPDGAGLSFKEEHTFLMPDSSLTLYAQWEIDGHYLNFYPNGGLGNMNSLLVGNGQDTTLSTNAFSYVGYQFSGWNTEADGSGQYYDNEAQITMSNSNINLYAQWVANTYTINYHSNSGIGFMESKKAGYSQEIKLDSALFQREGYTFNNWNIEVNGFGKKYNDQEGFTKGLGDLNLFAQWKAIDYKITYRNIEGAVNTNQSTYNIESPTIDLSHCIKRNKAFDGWYTDSLLLQKVNQIPQGTMGDKILYAKWSNEFKIAYYSNGGEGNTIIENITISGSNYTVKENPFSRKGYKFTKWNTLPDGSGQTYYKDQVTTLNDSIDFVLFAIWEPIQYSINYVDILNTTNSNRTEYNSLTPSFALADLSVKGFSFQGWYTDSLHTKAISYIPQGSIGDTILYALWERNKYTVSCCKNYGDGQIIKQSYFFDSDTTLNPKLFTRKGYTLSTWNTLANGSGTSYLKNEIIHINDEDIVLYAQWKLDEYEINYHNTKGLANSNPKKYNINSNDYTFSDLHQTGHTFYGWYTDSIFSQKINFLEKGDTGNLAIYAKWKRNSYYISYNKNGGAGAMSTQNVLYQDSLTLSDNNFSHLGYTFSHWNTQADNSGIDYLNKEEFIMSNSSINLFAQWNINTYNIQYNNLKGVVNTNPKSYDVEDNIVLDTLSKVGYDFLGWYTDISYNTELSSIAIGDTGHLVLYAKWKRKSYQIAYSPNGGTGVMTNQNILFEDSVATKECDFTRKGYTFSHWNTKADNTGTDYVCKQQVMMVDANISLYAQWNQVSYAIKYKNVKGAINNNPQNYNIEDSFGLAHLSLEDYNFIGWFTGENGTLEKTDIIPGDTGLLVLYAKWKIKTFNVHIGNGGRGVIHLNGSINDKHNLMVNYGDTLFNILAVNNPDEDVLFAGWADGVLDNPRTINNITEDIDLKPRWETVVSIILSDTIKTYDGQRQDVKVNLNHKVDYSIKYKRIGDSNYSNLAPLYAGEYKAKVEIEKSGYTGQEECCFTIKPKTLTIEAQKDQSKHYGEDDPDTLHYTCSGLVNNDKICGSLSRSLGETPGYYPIQRGTIRVEENNVDTGVFDPIVSCYDIKFISNDFFINSDINIYCKWEYMLVVDNVNNEFASYQWYKDGEKIAGATKQYYYNETHTLCGAYQCEVSFIGVSSKLMTEPRIYDYCNTMEKSVRVFPNPTLSNGTINISLAQYEDATLNIYSSSGIQVSTQEMKNQKNIKIQAPKQEGIYELIIVNSEGKSTSYTILVR